MKKLFFFLICSALVWSISSCKNEEDDIWDTSSAERLENAKKEYTDLLSTSPNGWVMQYYPTPTSKGYIYLMNFYKDGTVRIGAKNEWLSNVYQDSLSLWEVIGDNGPVVTFNSYNPVFHILASPIHPLDPSVNKGYGLEGDYEFMILKPEVEDELMLKGKKRSTYIHMSKLAEGQDWKDYFNKADEINRILFTEAPNALYLIFGPEKKYTLYDGATGIFGIVPEGGDKIADITQHPFVITDSGLRLYESLKEGETSVQAFTLNAERTRLSSVENSDVYIENEPPVGFFLRMQHGDDTQRWVFNSNKMSPKMKEIWDKMYASCSARGLKLSQMACNYLEERNSFEVYVVATKGSQKLTCNYDYDFQKQGDDVMKWTFKTSYDTNGEIFYQESSFKEMLSLLSSSFKLASDCEVILNLAKIKFVSTDNSDIWFTLEL